MEWIYNGESPLKSPSGLCQLFVINTFRAGSASLVIERQVDRQIDRQRVRKAAVFIGCSWKMGNVHITMVAVVRQLSQVTMRMIELLLLTNAEEGHFLSL